MLEQQFTNTDGGKVSSFLEEIIPKHLKMEKLATINQQQLANEQLAANQLTTTNQPIKTEQPTK